MREIKFRGKSLNNGEWVHGDLIENQGRFFIYHAMTETTLQDKDGHIVIVADAIDNNTVGQYTGLKDRNGKEIYEGDIIDINYKYDAHTPHGCIPDQDCICLGVVEYSQYTAAYELRVIKAEYPINVGSYKEEYCLNLYSFDLEGYIDLVGNIHDNPELLED